jgi:hypothetical protein
MVGLQNIPIAGAMIVRVCEKREEGLEDRLLYTRLDINVFRAGLSSLGKMVIEGKKRKKELSEEGKERLK